MALYKLWLRPPAVLRLAQFASQGFDGWSGIHTSGNDDEVGSGDWFISWKMPWKWMTWDLGYPDFLLYLPFLEMVFLQ